MNIILILCLLSSIYWMVYSITNMKQIVIFDDDLPYKSFIKPLIKILLILISGLVGFLFGPLIPFILVGSLLRL